MLSKKSKILFLVLLAVTLFGAGIAAHATTFDYGLAYGQALGFGTRDFRAQIIAVIKVLLSFLGIVALLVMLYGGWVWMTAGGRADRISRAKLILINGVIGLLIVFSAYGLVLFATKALNDATGGNIFGGGPGGGPGPGPGPGGLPGWCDDKGFAVEPLAPYVCDVIPDTGTNGSVVTIRGYRFGNAAGEVTLTDGGGNTYTLNLVSCPIGGGMMQWGSNAIKAVIEPVGGGIMPVAPNYRVDVVRADAVADANENPAIVGAFDPRFEVVAGVPGPAIFCLDPDVATIGDPVNIYGTRFGNAPVAADKVTLNGSPAPIDILSAAVASWADDAITLNVPIGAITGNVTVENGAGISNPDTLYISCSDNADCASGCCFSNACYDASVCFGVPKITYVSPAGAGADPDDASDDVPQIRAGNLITIFGEDFLGALLLPGEVWFCGADTDADMNACGDEDDKQGIPPPANPKCALVWEDEVIVVQVPENVVPGPIRVTRSDTMQDATNDANGPAIVDAVLGPALPGLCKLTPDSGPFNTNVSGDGINMNKDDTVDFGYGTEVFAALNSKQRHQHRIAFTVPNLAPKNNVSVRVKTPGGDYSNALPFDVTSGVGGPVILSFDKQSGPKGSYVTITGSGFRVSKGANGTVFFCNGNICNPAGGAVEGDFAFPEVCADSVWSDAQIIVKVPSGAPTGLLQVRTNLGDTDTTSDLAPKNFTVVAGIPGPQLCKLLPNNGPEGLALSLFGENFGAVNDTITFWNAVAVPPAVIASWSDGQIDAQAPFGAVTGPVTVTVGAAVSNPLNFAVGMCEPVACAASGAGNSCCADGSCRQAGACPAPAGPVTSSYSFRFSTGVLLQAPYVEEVCNPPFCKGGDGIMGNGDEGVCSNNPEVACSVNNQCENPLSSPSPSVLWPGGNSICTDPLIIVLWMSPGAELDDETIREGDTVKLQKCDDASCATGGVPIDVSVFFKLIAVKYTVFGGSFDGQPTLEKNTWYRVVLTNGIQDLQTPPQAITRLNFDENGDTVLDAYMFKFKTRNTDECELDAVAVVPPKYDFTFLGEQASLISLPFNSDTPCQFSMIAEVNASWSVNNPDGNPLGVNLVQVANPPILDIGLATALRETIPGSSDIVRVTLDPINVSGSAPVTVQFADPYVMDAWPMCEEACINAEIAARFNIGMDDKTFDGVGGVQLRNMTANANVPLVNGIYNDTRVINFAQRTILTEHKYQLRLPAETPELSPNTAYRAIFPDSVTSASGKPLTRLNYNLENNTYCTGEWHEQLLQPAVLTQGAPDPVTSNRYYAVLEISVDYPHLRDSAVEKKSTLEVLENKTPADPSGWKKLGPAHSKINDIRAFGWGRYSDADASVPDADLLGAGIYFSASDNTDPTVNGYAYKLRYQPTDWQTCDAYAWDFATKDATCQPDRVVVQPPEATLHTIGAIQDFRADVYSSPDSCSAKGQLLNASGYDPHYAWNSSDVAIASLVPPTDIFTARARAESGSAVGSTVDIKTAINPPGVAAALSCNLAAQECGELTVQCGYVSDAQCGVPTGTPVGVCNGEDLVADPQISGTCSNDGNVACLYDQDCDFGVGTSTCCYPRPWVVAETPINNMVDVCRNTRIAAEFSEVMDSASYKNNTLLEANYTLEGNCPPGAGLAVLPADQQPRGFFSRIFAYVKDFWNKLLGRESHAASEVWCRVPHRIKGEATSVDLVPQGVLESDREYRVTLNDTQNGLDEGLVLHLPFDGDAQDTSGSGNDGTINGDALLIADHLGNLKSAYQFDGVNDYIEVANSSELNFDANDSFSYGAWLRYDGGAAVRPRIIAKRLDDGGGALADIPWYDLYLHNDQNIAFSIVNDFPGNAKTMNDSNAAKAVTIGQWYYAMVVRDTVKDTVSLYVNGILSEQLQDRTTGVITYQSPLTVGAYFDSGARSLFKGAIDDVRVYNRALTEQEILTLATGGAPEGLSLIQNGVKVLRQDIRSFADTKTAKDFYGYVGCTGETCNTDPFVYSTGIRDPAIIGANTSTLFTYQNTKTGKMYIGVVQGDPTSPVSDLETPDQDIVYQVESVTPGISMVVADDAGASDTVNGVALGVGNLPTLQRFDKLQWHWRPGGRSDGALFEVPRGDWQLTLSIPNHNNGVSDWRFSQPPGVVPGDPDVIQQLNFADAITIRYVAPKGIQSVVGVGLDGVTRWNFTTGDVICDIARVETTVYPPDAGKLANVDLFHCAKLDTCDGDQADGVDDFGFAGEPNEPGNQHHYAAQAKSASGQDLLADYTWVMANPESVISNFYDANNLPVNFVGFIDSQNVYMDTTTTNGSALVTVTATDPLGVAGSQDASIRVINFMCQNPWPDLSLFPYQDTNACDNPGAGCASTNFETFYCRDAGGAALEDDLPLLAVQGSSEETVTGRDSKKICFGGTRIGETCVAPADCPGVCKNGVCALGAAAEIGTSCGKDADCLSGIPADDTSVCGPLQIKNVILQFQ